MNIKSLKILEYDKIVAQLEEYASSPLGKALCKELLPSTNLYEIRQAQTETTDALTRVRLKGGISFSGLKDVGGSLKRLEVGSSLGISELLSVSSLLTISARAKAYGRHEESELPDDSLEETFRLLEPLTPLNKEIQRCILSEDEVSDDASPGLHRVRRSMNVVNGRIHSQLNSLLNSNRTYLQEAIVTMRDGRYCLPVKAEHKNQVSGMVHDQSSTGSTLFIEPMAVIQLNNELRELEIQEKKEIEAILADLSNQVAPYMEEIHLNQQLLTKLDFIFAKAALSRHYKCSEPKFNTDGYLNIKDGRHPLLDPAKVVPINIHLGKTFDLLVVTGPNTGGKTVSLKTVGLFTLMGQAGLHIPAFDGSELAVFEEVFADIGDEQSIEQSLSTFSAHMTNIVSILSQADSRSLCLFDELGAGTDPTEGAALAISILSFLHNMKCRAMATTHYSELKVYALTTPGVENACCEFSVENLQPTYRLLIGIPGKSNAFAISRRLGLPEHIIDAARSQISEEKESFEDLIADLETSKVTIEKEEAEIRSYKQEIETLKKQLETKREKLDASRDKILQEAHAQARDILQEAKDTADETIRAFQKAGPGASMKDLEASRQKLRKQIDEKNSKLSIKHTPKPENAKPLKASDVKPGDAVKILSMGLKGTVSSRPDHKGNLFVQCGIIRTQANIKDIIPIQENDVTGPSNLRMSKTGTGSMKMSKSLSVSTEINLLGMTTDEALSQLDKYLDDAYLAHLPSVRIVHGKGTGALRNAVQRHLRGVRYVESFRLGEHGEGDAGVTIAVFRK